MPCGVIEIVVIVRCPCCVVTSRPNNRACMLQDFDQHLNRVAKSDEWAKVVHARSDISDERGYTSYLEEYGVLRLPTLVLFRNGRPLLYSYDEPFTQSGVEKWLHKCVRGRVGSSDPLPHAPPRTQSLRYPAQPCSTTRLGQPRPLALR